MKIKVLFAISILTIANFGCSSSLTSETSGQIKSVVLDRDTKTVKRKTSSNKKKKTTKSSVETEIEYTYSVNGKTYEGYSEKDGDVQSDFRTDSAVVVCYNPSKPEESDVFANGSKCGS